MGSDLWAICYLRFWRKCWGQDIVNFRYSTLWIDLGLFTGELQAFLDITGLRGGLPTTTWSFLKILWKNHKKGVSLQKFITFKMYGNPCNLKCLKLKGGQPILLPASCKNPNRYQKQEQYNQNYFLGKYYDNSTVTNALNQCRQRTKQGVSKELVTNNANRQL